VSAAPGEYSARLPTAAAICMAGDRDNAPAAAQAVVAARPIKVRDRPIAAPAEWQNTSNYLHHAR
jgi:hypothetical protein